jgi:hypothetical protein
MSNWPCSIKKILSFIGIENAIVLLHPLGPLPDVDPAVYIQVGDGARLEDLGILSLTLHALSRRLSPTPFRFWIEASGLLATEKTIWNLDQTLDHIVQADKSLIELTISSFVLDE